MANLRGSGSMTQRNLIVDVYKKNKVVDKEGQTKGYYIDAQIDQSMKNPDKVRQGEAGKQAPDANPHLVSNKKESKFDKGEYVDHRFYVTEGQLNQMYEAAGGAKGKTFKENEGTENERLIMGIQADLIMNKDKEVVINTKKPMGPSKNPHFGRPVLEKQEAVTAAKKEYNASVKEQRAKEAEAEAQQEVEVENDGPEVDAPF